MKRVKKGIFMKLIFNILKVYIKTKTICLFYLKELKLTVQRVIEFNQKVWLKS